MDILDPIIKALDDYTLAHPVSREHDMIKWLSAQGISPFPQFDLKYSRSLFSAHFLLKHCLYQLQRSGLKTESFVLFISSIRITRQPYYPWAAATASHDPVREYYLNIDHYFETTEQEVNDLLDGFWQRFLLRDDKAQALAVLELDSEASIKEIMGAYRRLAQIHHPDKGGAVADFLRIQAARDLLAGATKGRQL
ncbi:MAG: molecular chaperone DnaJ [Oleiphilus sp.]|nr:MAG: molecular chaperone DnaJ [Oleiphilus sp.]